MNLNEVYREECSPFTPILFLIGKGADPSQELKYFGKKIVGEENFIQIAMGKGSEQLALEKLKNCIENGLWLCLTNIHLMPNFTLQIKKVKNLKNLNGIFR